MESSSSEFLLAMELAGRSSKQVEAAVLLGEVYLVSKFQRFGCAVGVGFDFYGILAASLKPAAAELSWGLYLEARQLRIAHVCGISFYRLLSFRQLLHCHQCHPIERYHSLFSSYWEWLRSGSSLLGFRKYLT